MSAGEEESTLQELVIIRRRGGDDDAPHKGGVWKIAYADFMTAMMAFFLVMWLINATDKKVLTQVATYFNPLRLTDKSPTPRGLHDSDTGAPGSENAPGQSKMNEGKSKGAKLSPEQQKIVEDALFKDPYGTLEILAQRAAEGPREQRSPSPVSAKAAAGAKSPGEAFRDPFDPEVRQSPTREMVDVVELPVPQSQPASGEAGRGAVPGDRAASADPGAKDKDIATPAVAGDRAAERDASTSVEQTGKDAVKPVEAAAGAKGASDSTAKSKMAAKDPAGTEKASKDPAAAGERTDQEQAAIAALEAEIRGAVNPLGGEASPEIEVKVTDDGLLISLTDKFDFGMFAIASAEPRPATVAIMEKIAKVLQARPGQLVIRGHTDGRPFRSSNYDNWRLSTARAHMAYYMLVRGGLDEKRVERVEGHADRSLRVPEDPEAAQNRRIELLLRKPKP